MTPEIPYENIDWNEMWRNAKLNSTWRKVFGERDTIEYWNKRAENFDRNTRDGRGDELAERLISRFNIDDNTTVLDIGAGTGRLAIPLAKVAKSITAVEPSAGMMNILLRNAEKEDLHNINVIEKKWEEVDEDVDMWSHDLVLASHSLGLMNIEGALRKMNCLAERSCCVITFGGKRIWDFSDLWPLIYGEKFVPGPNYIHLVNILFSMRINANVEVKKVKVERQYSDIDEALSETKLRLDISDDDKDDIIRDHLLDTLVESGGKLTQCHDFEEVMIWWEK